MQKIKIKTIKKTYIFPLLALTLAGAVFAYHTAPGHAQSVQQLQGEIDQLQGEIQQSQERLQELREREDTLENKLEIIQTDIDKIQKELRQTREEIAAKKAEIRETERELQRKKEQMQDNAETLYKEGDPSTLEILFSSDNFSEFISRKQYLDSVKKSLDESAARVKELQEKLKEEKATLDQKRRKQASKKQALEARRNEQRQLLEKTRGEEKRYQELMVQQRKKLERKREQQREALAAAIAARSGNGPDYSGYSSYPFTNASMNYNDRCIYPDGSSGADGYGYCKRQCTSYAAWKLNKDGKSGYRYLGHAINWRDDGRHVNFRDAQSGDILVWDVGSYGHVMYVEGVADNGLNISQYNVPYDSGKYSSDFYSWSELENGVNGTNFYLRRF